MGQRVRLALAIGLVFVLPLSCGGSSGSYDDDDDAGDGGSAAKGGRAGASGTAGRNAPAGGSSGRGGGGTSGGTNGGTDAATSGGATTAGNGGTAGTLTLPAGGRNFFTGGTGGNAGMAGGVAGKGGAGASGRGGAAGAPTVAGTLGASCVKDADCEDPTLICLGSSDLTDGSGPPGGLCTRACSTGDDCAPYGAAYCYVFANDDGYCMQACATGAAGTPKCQSRDDFACSLVGLIPGGSTCTSNPDCDSDELCDPASGTCGKIVTGCVPQCAGDFQCKSGEFCDFTTGLCVPEKPSGLPLGSECSPPIGNGIDACQGFCDAGTNPEQGICESLCVLQSSFVGCGWNGTGTPDQVCLFGTVISPPNDAAPGDVGICDALCDCNADCLRTGDVCVDESGGNVEELWMRKGYCRPLQAGETQADTFASCSTGAGGQAGAGG